MAVVPPTLTQALAAIGNAHVYVGDPFLAGGLAPLGQKEGAVSIAIEDAMSDLRAPEITGPAVHASHLLGTDVRLTVPLILGDPAVWAKISPTGTRGIGFSSPQAVVTTSLLIIPDDEVGAGLTYNGTVWAPAAPVNAIWIWKARVARAGNIDLSGLGDNGGKAILPVTFQAMFDAARPEGHKIATIGDPTSVAGGSQATLRI